MCVQRAERLHHHILGAAPIVQDHISQTHQARVLDVEQLGNHILTGAILHVGHQGCPPGHKLDVIRVGHLHHRLSGKMLHAH